MYFSGYGSAQVQIRRDGEITCSIFRIKGKSSGGDAADIRSRENELNRLIRFDGNSTFAMLLSACRPPFAAECPSHEFAAMNYQPPSGLWQHGVPFCRRSLLTSCHFRWDK